MFWAEASGGFRPENTVSRQTPTDQVGAKLRMAWDHIPESVAFNRHLGLTRQPAYEPCMRLSHPKRRITAASAAIEPCSPLAVTAAFVCNHIFSAGFSCGRWHGWKSSFALR